MSTRKLYVAIFIAALLANGSVAQTAQQDSSSKSPSTQMQQPVHPYRLDFSLIELDGGKTVDSRQYSLNLSLGQPGGRIQIGNRVPVGTKNDGSFQYIDVGTTIGASLNERGGDLALNGYCEVTSVAPGQDTSNAHPILRTLQINTNGPVTEGKRTILGVADDPDSKRQFELDVTVTELK